MDLRRARWRTLLFGLTIVVCCGPARADRWDDAEKAVVRIVPTRALKLPAAFLDRLVREGCTIPQPAGIDPPRHGIENVISGSFAARGQRDHAVLCSKDGASHIEVFWGGPARCPEQLERGDDRNLLQGWTNDTIVYSRAIARASQATIARYGRAFGGPEPADRRHAGIEDNFVGKASTILYCTSGSWTELQGMD